MARRKPRRRRKVRAETWRQRIKRLTKNIKNKAMGRTGPELPSMSSTVRGITAALARGGGRSPKPRGALRGRTKARGPAGLKGSGFNILGQKTG
ncbi:hypothetical protein LCGC14_2337480 [marine sediment metagenome]|uniref:Uncharacterized protein n=1 Tax=marine sediment metagenome TaxID=412755 RepID=A0A0F9F808_9ZZZZ